MLEFKRFKIKLKSITPFHIGTGDEYYPIEYVLDRNQRKLCVIDEVKLLENVERAGKLDEFTRLSSNPTSTNKALIEFIRRYASEYRYCDDVDELALDYISNERSAFRAGISKFIRNSLDDKVYIPGSTFKGALRSAVIDFFMRRLELRFRDEDSKKKVDRKTLLSRLRKDCSELDDFLAVDEQGNFAQRDIMKFVKVSDFLPIGDIKQKIYKVFSIRRPKNGIRDIKDIPDILECVDAKSEFEGEILIYTEFLEKLNKMLKNFHLKMLDDFTEKTLSTWMKQVYVNRVYLWEDEYFALNTNAKAGGEKSQYTAYLDKLKNFKLSKIKEKMFYVKLGKHGGAVSKTIEGCRQIRIKIGNTGKYKDGFHQSTLWLAGGYPMGWLKGEVLEG